MNRTHNTDDPLARIGQPAATSLPQRVADTFGTLWGIQPGPVPKPKEELPPFARKSSTSRAAAIAKAPTAATDRDICMDILRGLGTLGATAEELGFELAARKGLPRETYACRSSASARLVALRDAGLVADSGRTRPTRSGRNATVWVAAEYHRPEAA